MVLSSEEPEKRALPTAAPKLLHWWSHAHSPKQLSGYTSKRPREHLFYPCSPERTPVNTSVVQNAVGTLDKLMSEAKGALTQVQVETFKLWHVPFEGGV